MIELNENVDIFLRPREISIFLFILLLKNLSLILLYCSSNEFLYGISSSSNTTSNLIDSIVLLITMLLIDRLNEPTSFDEAFANTLLRRPVMTEELQTLYLRSKLTCLLKRQ